MFLLLILWIAVSRLTHADLTAPAFSGTCFPFIPFFYAPDLEDCKSAVKLYEDDIDFDFSRRFGALGAKDVQRALPASWAIKTCEISFKTRDDKNVEAFTLSEMLQTVQSIITECVQNRGRIGGWVYVGSDQGFYFMVQPNSKAGDITVTVPYNLKTPCQPWLSLLESGAVAKSPSPSNNHTDVFSQEDFCGTQTA